MLKQYYAKLKLTRASKQTIADHFSSTISKAATKQGVRHALEQPAEQTRASGAPRTAYVYRVTEVVVDHSVTIRDGIAMSCVMIC